MITITNKIVTMLPQLTNKQKILGKYICDNIFEVTLMNAPLIASKAGVSEATLTRFVYTLGYPNFSSFQLDLRKQIHSQATNNPFRQENLSNQEMPIYDRVFNLEKSIIEELQVNFDANTFEDCVGKLMCANNVMVVGGPVSNYAAKYFTNYLSVMRGNVSLINNIDLAFYGPLQAMGQKSVALVFSFPRYPKESLKIAQALKDRNVPIIGITDSPMSPITSMADYLLFAPMRYLICVNPTASLFALLHSLLLGVYVSSTSAVKKRFNQYEKDIISTDIFEYKDFNFSELL